MKKILSNKKILMTVLSIILVLVVMTSTTYSLFFKVHTMNNTESYTAGILDIKVEEGSKLELINSLPITNEEGATLTPYTFTITNVGNLSYTFDLKLLSTTNDNLINPDYIKIKLDDKEPLLLSSLSEGILAKDLTLNPEESITMSIRIWLSINTPNTEIGKTFSAKIVTDGIGSEYVEPKGFNLTVDKFEELGVTINSGTPDFSQVATTDEGVWSAEDDLETSYYFRGASENNYVKFAGYYWRIIRLNGDGTIRMIYDGTSVHANGEASEDRQVSTTVFNDGDDDNAYVGYMYGTPGSSTYEDTHANINDSTIKAANDNWYKTNIEDNGYSQYVADAIYCNDRSLSSGTGIGTTETIYMPFDRFYNNNPNLKCVQTNDKFATSSSSGNGRLTYPVGLISADEVVYAGGTSHTRNSQYYLCNGQYYWTTSPSVFHFDVPYGYSDIWLVLNSGDIASSNVNVARGLRPVISLKSDTTFSGNGTMDSPFEVVE